ncbi:ankyrin repeat domain-containing protein 66 isoform X1 [Protobothrops mucrosquamatus]|uniref:ankyrin repeat domain-containing protein 66 isoform X1 n=1 Tax=Protobothrops mucrosquamatus TaxID=103944 RepID=UPI000775E5FD|nr:ankyrin repeat domain-containing protein 66 isoform X1 [Protobothrops mucrosquamatus]
MVLYLFYVAISSPWSGWRYRQKRVRNSFFAASLRDKNRLLRGFAGLRRSAKGSMTELHEAAALGHSKMVKLLVAHGARLVLRTEAGWTPVHFAAESGRLGALRTLHSLHAPMDAPDLYGDVPRRIAEIYGHKACVKFLEIAEIEHRAYCQKAKSKGIQLDEKDEAWELKKEELLKSKPFSPKKHMKHKMQGKDGEQLTSRK